MCERSMLFGIRKILFFLVLLSMASVALMIYPANAKDVFIEYFHMSGCQDCEKSDPIIAEIEQSYINGTNCNVTFERVDTGSNEGLKRWEKYGFLEVPAVVINNQTKITKENITEENIRNEIGISK